MLHVWWYWYVTAYLGLPSAPEWPPPPWFCLYQVHPAPASVVLHMRGLPPGAGLGSKQTTRLRQEEARRG